MADIDIQRKEGRGAWPWLIGLLAVVLIVWGVWAFMDDDGEDMVITSDTEEQVAPADPAYPTGTMADPAGEQSRGQRFLAWVRDTADGATQQMGREHEYTREGLQRLTGALESLIMRDTAPQVQRHLETLRQQRQAVAESDAASSRHAAQVKQAFAAAVSALEELSQRGQLRQAQLKQHVDAARSSLEELDENTLLLEQRNTVRQFFEHMGRAIEEAERYAT